MKLLEGKKALVTGAAKGIGLGIARKFYENGADVMLADIDEAAGQKAAVELKKEGYQNRILFGRLDVSNEQSVRDFFAEFRKKIGAIDILVNNAAVLIAHEVKDFSLADWKKVYRVNMEGTFLCSREAVNAMIEAGTKGCILNVASASSRKADAKHAAYSSSKAAITAFARVLALEAGEYGIRVNSILPGATETEMLRGVFAQVEGMREEIIQKTVLGQLGGIEDQANAALFLCCDLARHITGEYLVVSGGEFMNA